MFKREELNSIWRRSRNVDSCYPITHDSLFGLQRLAVLRFLKEPLQSTLHEIIQQKVTPGTSCLYKGCTGTLNTQGKCSENCEQSGTNIVQDIIDCENCDAGGFPCTNCQCNVFRGQIKQYLDY